MSIIIQPGLTFRKTRIAPTPSGFLHLGNVLSFAITAALAKRTNAAIFLRIDDLDRPRIRPEYVKDIFNTLHFLNIPWNDGPSSYEDFETNYSQLHRMGNYHEALLQLKTTGSIYACNCSRTQIQHNEHHHRDYCLRGLVPFDAPEVSWRINTTNAAPVTIHTLQGDIIAELPTDVQHFVVRKKDGYPAYQLTSLLDDVHYNMDLIVRGQDLWSSTLAQLHLASLLGMHSFLQTTFYHHPLLTASSGEKLSKSAGATSIQYLRSRGNTQADIYNMIAAMSGSNCTAENMDQLAALLL